MSRTSPRPPLRFRDPSDDRAAKPRRLHVVIHGLVVIFVPKDHSYVELHVPTAHGHMYRAGTFGNLFELSGHDYVLTGVDAGQGTFDPLIIDAENLRLSEAKHGVKFAPDLTSTTARIRLPWPDEFDGVRQLYERFHPSPLFMVGEGTAIDPRSLQYVGLLTYKVTGGAMPVLMKGDSPVWVTHALNEHSRLHVFVDPPQRFLNSLEAEAHMTHAYHAVNSQFFASSPNLRPTFPAGESYKYEVSTFDERLPQHEQVDLYAERLTIRSTGCPGDCLRVMVSEE